jgi:hypothetical protein
VPVVDQGALTLVGAECLAAYPRMMIRGRGWFSCDRPAAAVIKAEAGKERTGLSIRVSRPPRHFP